MAQARKNKYTIKNSFRLMCTNLMLSLGRKLKNDRMSVLWGSPGKKEQPWVLALLSLQGYSQRILQDWKILLPEELARVPSEMLPIALFLSYLLHDDYLGWGSSSFLLSPHVILTVHYTKSELLRLPKGSSSRRKALQAGLFSHGLSQLIWMLLHFTNSNSNST